MKFLLSCVVLLIFQLGNSQTAKAEKVTCLPKTHINNEVWTSFYQVLEAVKTEGLNGQLEELFNGFDTKIFNPGNIEDFLANLNRQQMFKMVPAIHLDYLVSKINSECGGRLDLDLATISNDQCFVHLGLIELKIYTMCNLTRTSSEEEPFCKESKQNENDSKYKYCVPGTFKLTDPYVSAAVRG